MSASNTQTGKVSGRLFCKMLIPVVCFCLLTSSAIAAESPQAVVQNGTDQVLNILTRYPGASRTRFEQIEQVIDRYFDFEQMARLAVGHPWKKISQKQQREFTREFKKLLLVSYIGDVEKYARQSITYYTRSLSPGFAIVEIAIYNEGNPIYLDYSLHLKDANWRVYDISVSGMSLALRYRNQFDSFLANRSFDALLAELKQKTAQICRGGRC